MAYEWAAATVPFDFICLMSLHVLVACFINLFMWKVAVNDTKQCSMKGFGSIEIVYMVRENKYCTRNQSLIMELEFAFYLGIASYQLTVKPITHAQGHLMLHLISRKLPD